MMYTVPACTYYVFVLVHISGGVLAFSPGFNPSATLQHLHHHHGRSTNNYLHFSALPSEQQIPSNRHPSRRSSRLFFSLRKRNGADSSKNDSLHLKHDILGDDDDNNDKNDDHYDNKKKNNINAHAEDQSTTTTTTTKTAKIRMRSRIASLAKSMLVAKPPLAISSATPMPRAIASILKDATWGAVDMAVDEVWTQRQQQHQQQRKLRQQQQQQQLNATIVNSIMDEAFAPMEQSLAEMDEALEKARQSLEDAKRHAANAILAVEAAMLEQQEAEAAAAADAVSKLAANDENENGGMVAIVNDVEKAAVKKLMKDIFEDSGVDVTTLSYGDVGYELSEMAPPFIDEDRCLVPGEAVVRVEKAPDNSRRIFAGIDIPVSVDTVWNVLTDYANLQRVVPNLTVNKVLKLYDAQPSDEVYIDVSLSDEAKIEAMSKQLKGALLKQVGGAKVAGINFSARTTLEVREWPQGLPDLSHFFDDATISDGKSRDDRALDNAKIKLQRYRFPRPFAVSALPSRDISMQSIPNDDGEFRMYQGVWRMQPLPGCAPEGQEAMRLTYAVEVSPRAYLPVSLVEGRIVKDMCTNLMAIRDYLTTTPVSKEESIVS